MHHLSSSNNQNTIYLLEKKRKKHVKMLSSGLVTCNCKGFQFVKICKHSAAAAEKDQVLKIFVSKSKASQRAKLQKQGSGDGWKGHKDRRKREYSNASSTPSKSSNSSSPFSEIWHNNEPLYVCLTKDIP